jgi:ABC-2 type transport system permease protein
VPLSLLPGWTHPLSWILAPTWGYRGIHDAALGGNPWPGIWIALALGVIYFAIGQLVVAAFERRARERATLSLV